MLEFYKRGDKAMLPTFVDKTIALDGNFIY